MIKGFTSILAVFYLLISSGVVINMHYCMNRLDSTQLYADKSETCGRCGMHVEDSKGCCRDEIKIVKLQEDQKASSELSFDFKSFQPVIVQASEYFSSQFDNINEHTSHNNHSPPLLSTLDIYLQNCVFRI